MKKRKRSLAVLLSLLAAASSLTACTGGETTQSQSPAQSQNQAGDTSEEAQSGDAELEEASLKWYFVGGFPQTDQERIFGEVNKLLKERINATCEFVALGWGDYENKMNVVISSGQDYDVCYTSDFMNPYAKNVGKGAFAPLDDLLKEYAPETYASIDEAYWDAIRVNGKIYGVINQQVFARTPAVTIPKELAETYGFDLETLDGDLDNLTPFLDKVHADHPELAVRVGGVTTSFDTLVAQGTPGAVRMDDETLTVFNQFKSEEFLHSAEVLRQWNAKGYTHGEEFLVSLPTVVPGKLIYSAEVDGAYKPSNPTTNTAGIEVITIPFDKPTITTGGIVATMQAISANSKNKERAMMMLEIFNTDQDAYMLLNYGIKGEHWDTDEEGFLDTTLEASANYSPGVNWMFATNFMQIPYANEGLDIWERTKTFNAEAEKSVALGFSFDSEPVKNEIAKCSVIGEEYAGLKYGIYSEEEVAQMVQEMDDAGADVIIAELQRQLDAWAESNGKK